MCHSGSMIIYFPQVYVSLNPPPFWVLFLHVMYDFIVSCSIMLGCSMFSIILYGMSLRCEVTADDFETASMTKYSEVVGKLFWKETYNLLEAESFWAKTAEKKCLKNCKFVPSHKMFLHIFIFIFGQLNLIQLEKHFFVA